MKKIKTLWLSAIITLIFTALPAPAAAADFSVRLMPAYEFALESKFENVLTGIAAFDLSAFTVRSRDEIYFTAQATISLVL